ncbi:MAG: hypothetical protein OXN17_19000 [Candidatus Poribacteria bacterium]|nr:hypothetical protein [Candidatus Poribacteria bacterium]MDE0505864.1 hypothetical protein [Candidatus Poribacteria bacterium]
MKTLILLGSTLLLLPSCAAKLEEPELKLAPLVRLENFIVLDMGTVTMGHMTINALMTVEGAKYLEDNKRQIRRLEERLNAWYHKALRRLTYLRLNDPRESPIIITDLFKEVGDPINAFYRDERRRQEDLELGRRAIHMSFNDYICQVIHALDKEDEKLRFKFWQESKKDD